MDGTSSNDSTVSGGTAAAPQALDYGLAPPRRRVWARRASIVAILLATLLGLWRWGPPVWRQVRILYWQRQARNYVLPPDTVVYEEEPKAASALLAGGVDYAPYPLNRKFNIRNSEQLTTPVSTTAATNIPTCWANFQRLAGSSWKSGAVIFLHELVSPAGNRRLVCLEYTPSMSDFANPFYPGFDYIPSIYQPADITTEPKNLVSGFSVDVLTPFTYTAPAVRVYAGQLDPNDPSHFTIRYEMWGQTDVLDGRLDDNNRITLEPRKRLVDPVKP